YLASVDIRLLAGRRAAARRMPARGGAPELVGLDLMPRDGHRDGIWAAERAPRGGRPCPRVERRLLHRRAARHNGIPMHLLEPDGSRSKGRAALFVLSFAVSLGFARGAMASGYAIKEQSASLLGTAFAGAGSSAQDPSVMFFNPAGIARLDGYRISGSTSGVFPRTEFTNGGSVLAPLGLPISGGSGGDAGEDALVPAFYVTAAPNDLLHLGLSVNAPFGLSNEYSKDWVGRYHAIESTLETTNINPVVAVKPISWLSL